jgi:hypothetical protein
MTTGPQNVDQVVAAVRVQERPYDTTEHTPNIGRGRAAGHDD